MKGVFWNCNGFADAKKYNFLLDLTKEKNLDFIALSETGRPSFSQHTLNTCPRGFFADQCRRRDFDAVRNGVYHVARDAA
jgi:hypothetical protein